MHDLRDLFVELVCWFGTTRQDNGLCKDVFQQHHMVQLRGRMGLAHCRYPTAGGLVCRYNTKTWVGACVLVFVGFALFFL